MAQIKLINLSVEPDMIELSTDYQILYLINTF